MGKNAEAADTTMNEEAAMSDPGRRGTGPADLADRHSLRDPAVHAGGLRPGDPRRRPDHPPHQARHAHHGRCRDHLRRGGRLLRRQALFTGTMPTASAMLLLFLFVGTGLVGFLDDFIKIYKQRSLGLRSKAKMIGLSVVALTFGILAISPAFEDDRGQTPASQHLSFIRDIEGWTIPAVLVVLLIWFIVAGTTNGVNLTDGLDGLAAGAGVMVFGASRS